MYLFTLPHSQDFLPCGFVTVTIPYGYGRSVTPKHGNDYEIYPSDHFDLISQNPDDNGVKSVNGKYWAKCLIVRGYPEGAYRQSFSQWNLKLSDLCGAHDIPAQILRCLSAYDAAQIELVEHEMQDREKCVTD